MQNNTEEVFGFFKHPIKSNRQLVQNVVLIWLDINIVKDSDEYHKTVKPLRNVINTINTYTDSEECIQFINSMGNEKACVLVSGSIGEHIVPRIHNRPQVDSIFVFCGNIPRHRQWADAWPKIKGVYDTIAPVREALKRETELCEQNAIPISLMATPNDISCQLDQSFIYTRVLKETFLTIEFKPKHLTEFTSHCRTLLANNENALKAMANFEENYRHRTPIWWYTHDYFLRPMLNCALSQINIELLIKMAFFINDLHRQIEQLYKEQFKHRHTAKKFTVYRGQGISLNEFQRMKEIKNGLVTFNNFLSTSKDCSTSLEFVQRASKNPDLVGILFNMTIDPSKSTVPFASIKSISSGQDKDEMLFSMHAIFCICDIKPMDEDKRMFQVDLILTNETDEGLHVLTDRIRKESFPHLQGWHRLGSLLQKLGEDKQAQQIYEMLLGQTTDDKEKASTYSQIGRAKYAQGEYQEALRFYEQSLEMYKKALPPNHPDLATSFYHIGLAYQNIGNYLEALSSHEKALDIRQQLSSPDHPDLASFHDGIGHALLGVNAHQKAISSFEKALIIRQKSLPPNHPDLASSYDNLGHIYHQLKKYCKAISFYEKSLEIKQQFLFANHPDLAAAYNNLGKLYYKAHEFTQAVTFYEKALDIFQRVVPPNFSELVLCYGNIGLIHESMGSYLKACSSYERAVNIGEKASLIDQSIVQQQRKNRDRVNGKL